MLCITGCFLHGSSRFIKERTVVYDFMHPSSFGYILAYRPFDVFSFSFFLSSNFFYVFLFDEARADSFGKVLAHGLNFSF